MDDTDRELGAVLSYLLGRQLRTGEIIAALGVSRSAYYVAREEGRLITADNLLKAAAAFGLNGAELLMRFGLLSREDVLGCADALTAGGSVLTQAPTRSRPAGRRRLQVRTDAPPV